MLFTKVRLKNKTDPKLQSGFLFLGTCRFHWTENDSELDCETAITRVDDNDPFMKNCALDGFLVLTESDIPGASLNSKQPQELNIHQLKRWLACRGAPVTGKKPDLVER